MRNGTMHSDYFEHSQFQVELDDLLEATLSIDTPYPWNIADPEATSYLEKLEQGFSLDNWPEDEVAARSQDFFACLDGIWAQNSLSQRFATWAPQSVLNAIVQQAQKVFASNLSLAEQLVQCVQQSLPNWDADDLQVLARPLAYAMRGVEAETTEVVESTLKAVRPVSWEELSELEQARLSLSIARCALAQLHQTDSAQADESCE
ncbi:hypothetical protein [Trichocoleus sp. FACHB-262]|uniref:hypothetical protein n=1 Tax=Trichocoleus sp. FACHB-262 TaxID=2692869 RepID=UPI001686C826|nr:hypothetical protein [Trichocoleus sp. FACHB-262]MBD2123724.1 hypothetical protein [Trichocoleus sp. FACHB-262]